MQPVVLVTGASSGIGRALVQRFSAAGWRVAATLRFPERETGLADLPGVTVFQLDVDSEPSVQKAFREIITVFGRIDVVINNAGFGHFGVLEGADDPTIRRQFETNVFGLMRVTREALPILRRQGGGSLIQISSMAGRVGFPGYSLYHASKWAVEGFSESLAFELRPFNIRIRLIEPGNVRTRFYDRIPSGHSSIEPLPYQAFLDRCREVAEEAGRRGDSAEQVADTAFEAATDPGWRLRYPVGKKSRLLLWLHRVLPYAVFAALIRRRYRLR